MRKTLHADAFEWASFRFRSAGSIRRGRVSGVSLHSHTLHSEEDLRHAADRALSLPLAGNWIRRLFRRYEERMECSFDFSRAFWTPPLSPLQAYQVEARQIESRLKLTPLVSITDHDDIQAPEALRLLRPDEDIPISFEWSVPYRGALFHLGIHNLPPARAGECFRMLNRYTRNPEPATLDECMGALKEMDKVLVIFNHPLWDLARVGEGLHHHLATAFLRRYARSPLHALEWNGLRNWKENWDGFQLSRHFQVPMVGGGDRHGGEPAGVLNLSRARTFAEFVGEVREGCSSMLLMPQYCEPLRHRQLEAAWDILRDYPGHPLGRVRWTDRVFYRDRRGRSISLSRVLAQDPLAVQAALGTLQFLRSPGLRPAWRWTAPQREGVLG